MSCHILEEIWSCTGQCGRNDRGKKVSGKRIDSLRSMCGRYNESFIQQLVVGDDTLFEMTDSNNIKQVVFCHFLTCYFLLVTFSTFWTFHQTFFSSNYQFSDQDHNLGPPVFVVHRRVTSISTFPNMGTTLVQKSRGFGPGDGLAHDLCDLGSSPNKWPLQSRWVTWEIIESIVFFDTYIKQINITLYLHTYECVFFSSIFICISADGRTSGWISDIVTALHTCNDII